MTALMITIPKIAKPSMCSPKNIDTDPAMMRMIIRNEANCETRILSARNSFFLGISLNPYFFLFDRTCEAVRPVSR